MRRIGPRPGEFGAHGAGTGRPERGSDDDLLNQLIALGEAVGGGEVTIERAEPGSSLSTADLKARGDSATGSLPTPGNMCSLDEATSGEDVVILVGSTLAPNKDCPFSVVVCGDGWDAYCSSTETSPAVTGTSSTPFGPLLAACLAAGAIFRYFYQLPTAPTAQVCLWDFGPAFDPVFGSTAASAPCHGKALDGVALPPAHLIGLGAVGAAFALALACAPGLSGTVVGIDPQDTDPTGRNRLISAFHKEIGLPKVSLAARLFSASAIEFFPNPTRWPEFATDPGRHVPDAVRQEEDAIRYAWVISCVDRNVDRQNIAGYLPKHVLSGSTDGLVAQVAYYAMEGQCECLACNHPIPTFRFDAYVHGLQELSADERQARYQGWGLSPEMQAAVDDYLYHPTCGHVAEAELRRLGVEETTDWSVGFVSVACGVMLAAVYTRCGLEGMTEAIGAWPERRLIFLSPDEFVRSHAQRKPTCSICLLERRPPEATPSTLGRPADFDFLTVGPVGTFLR